MNENVGIGRKTEDEKLPFHLKLKKYRMLFSYYIKRSIGKFNLAYSLFVINIILVSFVLIPNLAHRSPVPVGSWPIVFELDGKVLIKANVSDSNNLIPASEIQVHIGGYHTTTDSNGEFHLVFTSQTYADIPIIFRWANKSVTQWISFRQSQFEKEEVFMLE